DAGGKNVAFDQTFTINVDDGNLDLDFVSNLDNAKIAAIEILPLDVFTEPRGAIVGVDFIDKKVTVALPDDASIGNDPTAVDIFPWRAPASGGNLFTIGGHNFDDLTNTSVTIGGEVANITSVSDGLIQGTLPNIDNAGGLVDVVVESGGFTTLLEDAFLPLI
ncbi:MAG: IPT/TIG domain-containing protein, partial [Xenococcus sp. (in: cyanobacteria)]